MELGDTSEDTRHGDGLDGQRLPPFCGPHGDSTPEPSWNQARALVSETHRRPSRRPFAHSPDLVYPTPRPILPVRPAVARLRPISAPTNSPDSRPGGGELVDAPGTHLPASSTGRAGGRPNSHSQLCEPVTWTTGNWCAGRCSLVGVHQDDVGAGVPGRCPNSHSSTNPRHLAYRTPTLPGPTGCAPGLERLERFSCTLPSAVCAGAESTSVQPVVPAPSW